MKLKVNDTVKIITGKDKGKTGKITKVLPRKDKVIVAGVNKYKRHLKKRDEKTPGGVVEIERPLHAAKVMLLVGDEVSRIGYTLSPSGDKIRVAKKTGSPIDQAGKK